MCQKYAKIIINIQQWLNILPTLSIFFASICEQALFILSVTRVNTLGKAYSKQLPQIVCIINSTKIEVVTECVINTPMLQRFVAFAERYFQLSDNFNSTNFVPNSIFIHWGIDFVKFSDSIQIASSCAWVGLLSGEFTTTKVCYEVFAIKAQSANLVADRTISTY